MLRVYVLLTLLENLESFFATYMLELFSKFDQRGRLKHSLRRHDQEPILHAVQVAHDQQQVVGLLHGQEPRPGQINIFMLILTDR